MGRLLFCEISPLTYKISRVKGILIRNIKNIGMNQKIAKKKQAALLPVVVYSHKSLIRRQLGKVDPVLQNNKANNLSIAAPKVSHVLILPNEVFSFWHLVGNCTQKKGYKEGLTIHSGQPSSGIGGGMCQFTNLIHWLVLHTPLQITEHHHHDGIDLFPDFGRQVPFGVGTSIFYNYLDYRFVNNTNTAFQLVTWVTDEYLCGEIRAETPLDKKYHVRVEDEFFSKENNVVYRNNKVYRYCVNKKDGKRIETQLLKQSHAKVLYDTSHIQIKYEK